MERRSVGAGHHLYVLHFCSRVNLKTPFPAGEMFLPLIYLNCREMKGTPTPMIYPLPASVGNQYFILLPLPTNSVASGDLRHLIRTVNGIPDDYPGKLTVLLNDVSPFVSARNLLLLLVLGGEGNPTTNADIALHLWYSTFLPVEYATRLSALSTFIQGKKINEENYVLRLQTSSGLQLSACMNEISTAIFSSYLDLTFVPDIQSACNEYQRVM